MGVKGELLGKSETPPQVALQRLRCERGLPLKGSSQRSGCLALYFPHSHWLSNWRRHSLEEGSKLRIPSDLRLVVRTLLPCWI